MVSATQNTKGQPSRQLRQREFGIVDGFDETSWAKILEKNNASVELALESIRYEIGEIVNRGSELDTEKIRQVICILEKVTDYRAAAPFIDCALFYDQIGCADQCLEVALKGLAYANRGADQNLVRRALSTTGIAFSRVCDYENACDCLEKALNIAREMQSKVFEFAALCNIVSVLLVMGLLTEAKSLALKLKSFPRNTPDLDHLHLQNSINGSYVSRHTGDFAAAQDFDRLAQRQLNSLKTISLQWRAYIHAEHAEWLIMNGEAELAQTTIDSVEKKFSFEGNFRAEVIINCAKTSCALANNDTGRVAFCLDNLLGLLSRSAGYAFHREDILRSLFELSLHDSAAPSEQARNPHYHRLLNEHIINVKHCQFFEQIARKSDSSESFKIQITNPTYSLPASFSTFRAGSPIEFSRTNSASNGKHYRLEGGVENANSTCRQNIEARFKTTEFSCAEDWAVAADYRADRAGNHSFQVGALSGFLALHLGISNEHSVAIEMACRLHDIGKLFVNSNIQKAVNLGKIDEYAVVCRHTIAGSSLLQQVEDPVFQLAGQVALMHHECWNGTGYPRGLRGEEILFEARICAVADAFVRLSNSSRVHDEWDTAQVVRQVSTLGGSQLDPSIVAVLVELVSKNVWFEYFSEGIHGPAGSAKLEVAKSKLIRAIN